MGPSGSSYRARSDNVLMLPRAISRITFHPSLEEEIQLLHFLSYSTVCVYICAVLVGVLPPCGMWGEAYIVYNKSVGPGGVPAADCRVYAAERRRSSSYW